MKTKTIAKKMTEKMHEIAFILLLNDKESHIYEIQT
jgi:hypothetical protein